MNDDEVLDTLEKMRRQAEEMALRKVKISETKHEKKFKKEKEMLECLGKLEKINAEIALLEEEEESILNSLRKEI
jgi:hypothetical protein